MARFGRGQPHPPIFLRAPLVAAIVAATISPIHVIQAGAHRPPSTHVYYVRPSRSSLVPDRLAPQSHVVLTTSTRHAGRDVDVVVLRNPLAPILVPDRVLQQSHVIQTFGARHPARDADVIIIRNPVAPAVAAAVNAPRAVVIQARTPRAQQRLGSVFVQPAWGAEFIPDRLPPQIHVLLQAHRIPKTHVVLVRNALVPPAAPVRLAPQVHIISQVASRLRAVRKPLITMLQGGPAPLVFVSLPLQIEDRSGFLYQLLDQSTKRYLVAEQSAVKLSMEDSST